MSEKEEKKEGRPMFKGVRKVPSAPFPENGQLEADVVIIGGGGSGIPASVSAFENGAKRVVMQNNMFFDNEVLMYPFVDLATDPLSKGPGSLEGPVMYVFNELHCKEEEAKLSLVSPVYATREELMGMPNTVIVLADIDNLKYEGQKCACEWLLLGEK